MGTGPTAAADRPRQFSDVTREGSDVTTGSIGPGTLLAGRYRLDDLLAESGGARFWRATDTILARSVAIHAVPSDDPRAPHLMEAARVSATVIDPHLLRVLDCDDSDGTTWVVNEWGDGISLDLMLQRGTLPPSRAAWLAREVAEAIAAGHAQGVAHGRLNPEAVLVTHAGAVKLIGYVVDASLEPPRPPDPLYGELDEREADVIDLAGILYAALTGRWPGVAPSAVPRAPRESRRPLRPRQVRAGVPRTLDAICDRVLHKEASQHAMPIETAQEIAAALADYVGDPGQSAPLDAAGMHTEATVSIHRDALAEAGAVAAAQEAALAASMNPELTQPSTPFLQSASQLDLQPGADLGQDPVEDPEATQLSAAVPGPSSSSPYSSPSPSLSPEDTQIHREPLESPDDLSPLQAPTELTPPPPPFEDLPERPLFASTERRVPAAAQAAHQAALEATGAREAVQATSGSVRHRAGNGGTADTGAADFWPFTEEPDAPAGHTGKEGRGWLRTAIVVGVLMVVVVAMAVAFTRGRQDGTDTTDPGSDPSSTASAPASQVLRIASVKDFDPEGDPPEENPETVGNAVDGDPATSWTTLTYRGNPALGGLKGGVGLRLDLGRERTVGSVTVRLGGTPTDLDVYAAPAGVTRAPDSLDQLDKVGTRARAPQKATIALDPTPKTRYLVVWLTRLPAADGGFRGEITDVTVRS